MKKKGSNLSRDTISNPNWAYYRQFELSLNNLNLNESEEKRISSNYQRALVRT